MSLDSPSSRAGGAAGEVLTFGRLAPVEEALAALSAVTGAEVAAAAAAALAGPASAGAVGSKRGIAAAELFLRL
jgi:predicted Zn-dependent peptidase